MSEKEDSFDKSSDNHDVNHVEKEGKDKLPNAEDDMLAIKKVVNLDGNSDRLNSDKVSDERVSTQKRNSMQSVDNDNRSCDGQMSETDEKRPVIDVSSGSETSSSKYRLWQFSG